MSPFKEFEIRLEMHLQRVQDYIEKIHSAMSQIHCHRFVFRAWDGRHLPSGLYRKTAYSSAADLESAIHGALRFVAPGNTEFELVEVAARTSFNLRPLSFWELYKPPREDYSWM
jgi:hypothetical protein